MSRQKMICPKCGETIITYRNPLPTVDIIIELGGGVVLIERKNPPFGWALPGGFVDYGESLEEAARREALEETGLEVELICQFHTYSDPRRDPRQHTISTVFVARAQGIPQGGDDAKQARVFSLTELPQPLVFDHQEILEDYLAWRKGHRPGGKNIQGKTPSCR
ncbi:NUDIX domain-containing protein [Thermosulfuriphilus sp.]